MGKSLTELPPTSSSLHGKLLCSHYFIFLSINLLIGNIVSIDACLNGWEQTGFVLLPSKHLLNMPYGYYITCGCSGCTRNHGCRSIDVLCTAFHNYFIVSMFISSEIFKLHLRCCWDPRSAFA